MPFENNLPLVFLRIQTTELVGEYFTPPYPHPDRPKRYKQRTLKRWRRAHPPYYKPMGNYFLIEGRTMVCHPADLPVLRQALRLLSGR